MNLRMEEPIFSGLFFVFLSDILAIAISDSALQVFTSDLRTEAVDVGLTGGLLTIGLVLLFQGARRIKHYYLRTSKIPLPGR